MSAPTSPYTPLLDAFFDRFPLIQAPQHRYTTLALCLAIGLESLASLSQQSTLSQCSFAAVQQRAATWMQHTYSTLSASAAAAAAAPARDCKYFEDPFQVYPNWWGNVDMQTLSQWKAPKSVDDVLQKWALPLSNVATASEPAERPRSPPVKSNQLAPTTHRAPARSVTTIPLPPTRRARPAAAPTTTAPPPPPPPHKAKPAPRTRTPATKSTPAPPPPPPRAPVTRTFAPSGTSHTVKHLVHVANTLSDDPIFQQFATHRYLDEQDARAEDPAWFRHAWVPAAPRGPVTAKPSEQGKGVLCRE